MPRSVDVVLMQSILWLMVTTLRRVRESRMHYLSAQNFGWKERKSSLLSILFIVVIFPLVLGVHGCVFSHWEVELTMEPWWPHAI